MERYKMVDEKRVKQGKLNKAQGAAFELRVRFDLEKNGFIVDKWTNNVEFDDGKAAMDKFDGVGVSGCGSIEYENSGKLIKAKAKWAGPGRPMMMGQGFPDFIAFRLVVEGGLRIAGSVTKSLYEVIGVEAKSNGYLRKEERAKCRWLLENKVFSMILIARKTKVKNRIVIVYENFLEIENRMKKLNLPNKPTK